MMEPINNTAAEVQHSEPTTNEYPKSAQQDFFKRGLKWFGAGVLCMAISFCITFFFFNSNGSSITYMYILTSVGVLCITKGLADLFGF
jgi:hypothetical protein